MLSFISKHQAWLLPLLLLATLTPFTPTIDLAVSNYFYLPNHQFSSNAFFDFLYVYGVIPAQLLFVLAAAVLFLSYFKKWKKWHLPALALVLTLLIGSGLIVHETFKEHWGRPRPKQTIEFGGTQAFRPYYKPNLFNQPEPSKGFSCGHCTMGFYFFAAALVAKKLKYTKTFWLFLLLALTLGTVLSIARIAQGGHFFSDTLVSAVVMWITAYACVHWLLQTEEAK